MPKLTKKVLDNLLPDPTKDVFAWDSELRGFGVRMKKSGNASFIIQYKTQSKETRRLVIGKVRSLAPDSARSIAKNRLAEIWKGGDPSQARHDAREAITVSELCERYMTAARAGLVITRFKTAKRQSTVAIDEGRISRHIVPLIGKKTANSLTLVDIQNMADAVSAGDTKAIIRTKPRGKAIVTGGKVAAARVVGLFGGIWSWGIKRGCVTGPSPTSGVETIGDIESSRVLANDELGRLGQTLKTFEQTQPQAVAAIRLIALTGLRREEACGLRWSEIDHGFHCLRLEETKTGRSVRPIGRKALQLLSSLPRCNQVWVFPNKLGTKKAYLKKSIARIFDAAGLEDAGGQVMRRTFSTTADRLGYSEATVDEVLGHKARGQNRRHYIRPPDRALLAAADRVSARISAQLDGHFVDAEIIDFNERQPISGDQRVEG